MIVVTDAGPIIHLSLVRLLRLLPALYQQIVVPDLVYKEVVVDGDILPGSAELRQAQWIEVVDAKRRGEIAEIVPVVTELRNKGVWLSDRLVLRILGEVGEHKQDS